ncbi:hypothetical protein DPMN_098868 [Dreissena polymorpha]|uniref:Uncharacterized protein n=1 Tax=Dreissena polymorpha TaxID=45954 RepID=A0A9D4LD55_DREPO|nr:hypothetical protein DPMN_098868 [Dreissena polymorpha]
MECSVECKEVRVTWELAPTGEDTSLSLSEMKVDIPVGEDPGPSSVVVETVAEVLVEWKGEAVWWNACSDWWEEDVVREWE